MYLQFLRFQISFVSCIFFYLCFSMMQCNFSNNVIANLLDLYMHKYWYLFQQCICKWWLYGDVRSPEDRFSYIYSYIFYCTTFNLVITTFIPVFFSGITMVIVAIATFIVITVVINNTIVIMIYKFLYRYLYNLRAYRCGQKCLESC